MPRITARDGNVIAADFQAERNTSSVTVTSEVLYQDGHILLTRSTAYLGDHLIWTGHFAADLSTGKITSL